MNSSAAATQRRALVWDLPVRAFHWLLAGCFAAAYILGEADNQRAAHALFGYTIALLIGFRILWGLIGTRYARFAQWPLSPAATLRYMRSLLSRSPEHHTGHTPAGSWAILALLTLLAGATASGAMLHNDFGPKWLEDLHEALAKGLLALILIHVVAVMVSSVLHRDNLVRAMLTGRKHTDAPAAAGPRIAVALLLLFAVGTLWAGLVPLPGIPAGTNLVSAVTSSDAAERHSTRADGHDRGRDDD
jgi:cytochrome b